MRSVLGTLLVFIISGLLVVTTPIGTGEGDHQDVILHPVLPHLHMIDGRIVSHAEADAAAATARMSPAPRSTGPVVGAGSGAEATGLGVAIYPNVPADGSHPADFSRAGCSSRRQTCRASIWTRHPTRLPTSLGSPPVSAIRPVRWGVDVRAGESASASIAPGPSQRSERHGFSHAWHPPGGDDPPHAAQTGVVVVAVLLTLVGSTAAPRRTPIRKPPTHKPMRASTRSQRTLASITTAASPPSGSSMVLLDSTGYPGGNRG